MPKSKVNIPKEIVFVLLLLVAYFFSKYIKDIYDLYTVLIFCVIVTLPLVAIYSCIRIFIKRKGNLALQKSFRDMPWLYDHKVIKISGRIEKVFTTHLTDKIIQSLRHNYRVLIADQDHRGRHEHQRFLISSPQIQLGSCVFISHNTSFGKVDGLQPGSWVEIQGEYIHRTVKQKGVFGPKFTYYGFIHRTYAPNYIKLLSDKPDVKALGNVEVVKNV